MSASQSACDHMRQSQMSGLTSAGQAPVKSLVRVIVTNLLNFVKLQ